MSAKCPACHKPGRRSIGHARTRVRICLNPDCAVGNYRDILAADLAQKASCFGWMVSP